MGWGTCWSTRTCSRLARAGADGAGNVAPRRRRETQTPVCVQIVKKTASQQRHEKDYGDRAQAHYDKMKERNKKRRSGMKT